MVRAPYRGVVVKRMVADGERCLYGCYSVNRKTYSKSNSNFVWSATHPLGKVVSLNSYPGWVHDAACQRHCEDWRDTEVLPYTVAEEWERGFGGGDGICGLGGFEDGEIRVDLLDTFPHELRVVKEVVE